MPADNSTSRFDAIIIGTGQSGPSLASRLTAAGMNVAVAERKLFGGTCVNVGCIPTKTLIASAHAAHIARRASDFGVVIGGPVTVDMKQVKARKDAMVRESNQGVESWLEKMERCRVYRGHARFEAPRTVRVGAELLHADKIFLNVGARASIPPLAGLDAVAYLTNTGMMDLDFLPRHLVIVGGNYVGLEFGQMYRRFGSDVTIVEKGPRLLFREDEDVSQSVLEIMQAEGIRVLLNANCVGVEKRGDGVAVKADCDGGSREVEGSHLLLATGRRPNTDDLGLDRAGIALDGHGYVVVDEQLRTSAEGVWAMGDCNGRGAFTHTSYNDYEIVAANLLDQDPRRVSDRITAYNVYIDPPLGRAGMTEAEVRKSGRPALIGKREMKRITRARAKSETQGFMKILVDARSRSILGAAVLGVGGDEIIHSILDVMYAKAPFTVIQRAVHIHPTVSELIPTMLGELKSLQ